MGKVRLEAFSDGVMAIIITIMVLELRVPHGTDVAALRPLLPNLLSYVLSFIYVGIYWNNHHHLLQTAERISGGVLWANLNLLFWLSLFPFATGWMGENHFASLPSAVYGVVLLMAAIAYFVLQRCIIAANGTGSILQRAVGADWKGKLSGKIVLVSWPGKLSPIFYIAAIAASFRVHWVPQILYVLVALVWLVPDRRIERAIDAEGT